MYCVREGWLNFLGEVTPPQATAKRWLVVLTFQVYPSP